MNDVQRFVTAGMIDGKPFRHVRVDADAYGALAREVEALKHRLNDADSLLKRCVECVNSAKYAAILHGSRQDEERIQTLIHDFQCYAEAALAAVKEK